MNDDLKDMDLSKDDNTADADKDTKVSKTIEEELAALRAVNAELIKTRDAAKRKNRELEVQQSKAQEEANKYKDKLISKTVNDTLKNALVDAGVLDNALGTALKLIDKKAIALNDEFEADLDSVKAVIEGLKTSDSILFKQVEKKEEVKDEKDEKDPAVNNSVKRASDKASTQDAYKVALQSAKTQKELAEVMRKFGITT